MTTRDVPANINNGLPRIGVGENAESDWSLDRQKSRLRADRFLFWRFHPPIPARLKPLACISVHYSHSK